MLKTALITVASVCIVTAVAASDYPQWRGADRSGRSADTGLAKSWPEGGPKQVWKAEGLGQGHSTPSVSRGRIYGMGLVGTDEVVWALDEKTGAKVWSTRIAAGGELPGRQGGYGPRSTPTIDGSRIYAEGVQGDVVCLNLADGKLLWSKNLRTDFGGQLPVWGFSESPLVDGDLVVVTPGGQGATMVALNKNTGATVWKAAAPEADKANYSSPVLATIHGVRQAVQMVSNAMLGVEITTGKILWRFNSPATPRQINCSSPVVKDNLVFGAAGYQHGGALGRIEKDGDGFKAVEVYFTKNMQNHHGGMVLVGDYLYGFNERMLTCLDFKSGEVKWENQSVGKGSVTYADGHIIARSERGPIALVEATAEAYKEKGRFEQPDRSRDPSWPYPVVANGKLYIRDQDVLLCYDLKASSAKR
jgi:outer membrane protein assembly factor BamB